MNVQRLCQSLITRATVAKELRKHGHVLFRSTGITSADELNAVGERIFPDAGKYNGTDKRNAIKGKLVDTGSVALDHPVAPHLEAIYEPIFPRAVLLGCLVAPPNSHLQGQTVLSDSVEVLRDIPASVLAKLERTGVQYIRNFGDAADPSRESVVKSWQQHFGVDSKAAVEAMVTARSDVQEWAWTAQDSFRTLQTFPAFLRHPLTDQRVFFNQALAMNGHELDGWASQKNTALAERPYHCRYGDGTDFSADEIEAISVAYERHSHDIAWEVGDVAVLDNLWVSHAKRACTQGPRFIGVMVDRNVTRDEVEQERQANFA